MGTNEISIAQIDLGRGDGAGHHLGRLAEIVLVVRAASGAIGVHQSWLTSTARSAAALGIIRGRWWHIPKVHKIELRDVYA